MLGGGRRARDMAWGGIGFALGWKYIKEGMAWEETTACALCLKIRHGGHCRRHGAQGRQDHPLPLYATRTQKASPLPCTPVSLTPYIASYPCLPPPVSSSLLLPHLPTVLSPPPKNHLSWTPSLEKHDTEAGAGIWAAGWHGMKLRACARAQNSIIYITF